MNGASGNGAGSSASRVPNPANPSNANGLAHTSRGGPGNGGLNGSTAGRQANGLVNHRISAANAPGQSNGFLNRHSVARGQSPSGKAGGVGQGAGAGAITARNAIATPGARGNSNTLLNRVSGNVRNHVGNGVGGNGGGQAGALANGVRNNQRHHGGYARSVTNNYFFGGNYGLWGGNQFGLGFGIGGYGWGGYGLGGYGPGRFGWGYPYGYNWYGNYNRFRYFPGGFYNSPYWGFGGLGLGFGLGYTSWPLVYGFGQGLYPYYCVNNAAVPYVYDYNPYGNYVTYTPVAQAPPADRLVELEPQVAANNNAAVVEALRNQPPALDDDDPVANARVFAEKGEGSFREGDYKGAVYAWKHALLDDPQNGMLLLMLGQGMLANGDYSQSAGATQQALQILPKEQWGEVIANFRELYGKPLEYTDHIRALEKAIKEQPQDPALRFLAGYHYMYLGYPKQALDQLDRGLKVAPRDLVAKKLRDEVASKLKPVEASEPAPPPQPGLSTPE